MDTIIENNVDNQEILEKVSKVLDLILKNIRKPGKKKLAPFRDAYSYAAGAATERFSKRRPKSVNKKCVNLLNQSLCSHRYEAAAKLLWVVCQDSSVFESYLYKAAMLIFENLQLSNRNETMLEIIQIFYLLHFVNKQELKLDYIIYGLKNNVLDLASKTKKIGDKRYENKTKRSLVPLYEAYLALVEYNEVCKNNIDDIDASQADLSTQNAINRFNRLIEIPGDWDIFVLKLIELLENLDRHEEVEGVLLRYIEINPNHLNAHIYLYSYLSKNDPDSEKLIHHLKIIAELSPSDERILELLEKLSNCEENLTNALTLIFKFLDYPSNGKNIQAWGMLSNLMSQVKSRRKRHELVTSLELWTSRSKSWYWLYFNPSQVHCLHETDVHLCAKKINVISYFEKENAYVEKVIEKFPSILNLL